MGAFLQIKILSALHKKTLYNNAKILIFKIQIYSLAIKWISKSPLVLALIVNKNKLGMLNALLIMYFLNIKINFYSIKQQYNSQKT